MISCLELAAVQDRPELFSTALMWLLAELFSQLPEVGDLEKPKLVFFFDEAHLLFDGATKAFLDSVERTVRMIRSKGVGIFFVTQSPTDLPSEVLGQLGARIQHALRAFRRNARGCGRAPQDRPHVPEVGLLRPREAADGGRDGEAAVTILSERGVPTPVVHTRLVAPRSSMTQSSSVDAAAKASPLYAKYGTRLDRESAREELENRLERAQTPAPPKPRAKAARQPKQPASSGDAVTDFLRSRQGQSLEREVVRGVFGMLRKGLDALEAVEQGRELALEVAVRARGEGGRRDRIARPVGQRAVGRVARLRGGHIRV